MISSRASCKKWYKQFARFATTSAVTLDDPIFNIACRMLQSPPKDFNNPAALNELRRLSDAIRRTHSDLTSLHALSQDAEMRDLALLDIENSKADQRQLLNDLEDFLVPPEEHDEDSALVEVKGGVGGSESAIFAGDLVRMYTRLSERKGWKTAIIESNVFAIAKGLGAGRIPYRQALLEVVGTGAYGILKHESGVHRVQRVPLTETAGRIHTSTAGVIVFPINANSSEEKDLFDMKDVKMEVMRSSGAGGQHVNRTESAVRLTHTPTGITVSMQDSRSQHQNRAKAFIVLRARLLDHQMQAEQDERRKSRHLQVRTSDRGEKIRTYNYPQDRVTDHRVPFEVRGLENVMNGESKLDLLSEAMARKHRADRLQDLEASLSDQEASE